MSAVRTVLAVALATALLASVLPVVEDARTNRTEARLEATVGSVERVAHGLTAREDPVVSGRPASRVVTVSVPSESLSDAPVRYLSFGGAPEANRSDDTTRPDDANRSADPTDAPATRPANAVYRVGEQPPRRVELDVRLLVEEPVVLGPGRHRLRLSLVRTTEGVGVRIRPLSAVG